MSKLKVLSVLLIAAFCAPVMAAESEGEANEVADHMAIISKNLKKLRRTMTDPGQNKDSSKLVAEAITHTEAAAKIEPPLAKDMSGDAKKEFLEGYKKAMEGMIAGLKNLKTAFDENRNADAPGLYKKLLTIKKDGHEDYTE